METIQLINTNGLYDCEIPVSTEEWWEILQVEKLTPASLWAILRTQWEAPGHRATATDISEKFGITPQSVNNPIWQFGRRVQKHLDRFKVIGTDGKPSYWSIPMRGRSLPNGYFEWELRPELAEAIERDLNLQRQLLRQAIEAYKQYIPQYWDKEKFKWKAVRQFQNTWNENAPDFAQMLEVATSKTKNLLVSKSNLPRQRILEFAQAEPEFVRQMFHDLFDESQDVVERANQFNQKSRELNDRHPGKKGNNHYQQANQISTYLWLRFPRKYSLYKNKETVDTSEKLHYHLFIKYAPTCAPLESAFPFNDYLCSELKKDGEVRAIIQGLIAKEPHPEQYDPDDELRTTTIDFTYFMSHSFKPNPETLEQTMKNPMQKYVDILRLRKNIILQGAPGTGKTYNTALIALGLIGESVDFQKHEEVMERYKALQNEGRIFFTTFHQSMDYEDFVEGLKPKVVDGGKGVEYEVTDGIFKMVCQKAKEKPEYANIESYIDKFISSIQGVENRKELPTISGRSSFFVWRMGNNNTLNVRSTVSNIEDQEYSPARLNIEKIKLQAKKEGEEKNWKQYAAAIINAVKKEYHLEDENPTRPVVLIIDEINRGNVSKIFGELITLLEPDKRLRGKHPITVKLPYSKDDEEPFGVPSNVYIIGTMNTTDRSTGTLDYALRRRFSFVTLKANKEIIQNPKGRELFEDVERFVREFQTGEIELDDLMIGHSYFMAENDDELKLKIEYEVIPLLKEYVKDGLLNCRREDMEAYFEAWRNLQTKPAQKDEDGINP